MEMAHIPNASYSNNTLARKREPPASSTTRGRPALIFFQDPDMMPPLPLLAYVVDVCPGWASDGVPIGLKTRVCGGDGRTFRVWNRGRSPWILGLRYSGLDRNQRHPAGPIDRLG